MATIYQHIKEDHISYVKISPVIGKECVEISFGARVNDFIAKETQINMFMTLDQLADLKHKINLELEKYDM